MSSNEHIGRIFHNFDLIMGDKSTVFLFDINNILDFSIALCADIVFLYLVHAFPTNQMSTLHTC